MLLNKMNLSRTFVILAFLFITTQSYAGTSEIVLTENIFTEDTLPASDLSIEDQRALLIKRKKTFKTIGWVSVGTGVVLGITTLSLGVSDAASSIFSPRGERRRRVKSSGYKTLRGVTFVTLFGGAVCLIRAHQYNADIDKLSFNIQDVGEPMLGLTTGYQPAVKLTLRF